MCEIVIDNIINKRRKYKRDYAHDLYWLTKIAILVFTL